MKPEAVFTAEEQKIINRGLTSSEVADSRVKHGANVLTPPGKDPLWKQWLEKFKDPTIIILCVCAVIALLTGLLEGNVPWDGVAILVAVCIATAGGTWSEYKADKAFELLKKDSDQIPVKVTRDGQFHTINSTEVVVGDLIHLECGDKIPADAELIYGIDLEVDESLMTGESRPVVKSSDDKSLIGGTYVVAGNGQARVAAVGDKTELGVLASALGKPYVCPNQDHGKVYGKPGTCEVTGCGEELVEKAEGATPLQKRLAGLADQISVWGTIGAVLIFVALVLSKVYVLTNFSIHSMMNPEVWPLLLFALLGIIGLKTLGLENKKLWMTLWLLAVAGSVALAWSAGAGAMESVKLVLRYFMVAVTIIVVAVPEGLPLAIFIALGLGMRKIREDNNLVRKMVAAETIGSATVICSDKTGTLTKNQMAVDRIFLDGKMFADPLSDGIKSQDGFRMLALGVALNSTAEVEQVGTGIKFVGNPTEGAVLNWLGRQGVQYRDLRDRMPIHSRACFTADRKMMTSVTGRDTCSACVTCPVDGVPDSMSTVSSQKAGCRLVFCKGAPERVLGVCSRVLKDKKVVPLNVIRSEIDDVVQEMAKQAVRPLAIAFHVCPKDSTASAKELESGLTLLAIIGLSDPIREDVPDAVRECNHAGIEVKMVTGDHPLTAHAIAQKIGMFKPDDIEMTGEQFGEKQDAELTALLPRLRVISRAKPDTKVKLVNLLQAVGQVVAMTGDGTNDAPALKKADVGISMGLKGTDVAKAASDIVLTDDNFGSILRAVHWGRTLYENLQKFLQFQLTVNLSALGIAFVSPIVATLWPNAGFQIQPLTVLQYLWINLIMDTLAAIAFGLEPPRPEAMSQKPKNTNEPFLTKIMLSNVIVLGLFFIGLILLVQATDILGLDAYSSTVSPARFALMKASVVFNCYVWFQIFHMFNARSVMAGKSAFANISKSRSFFVIMAVVAGMQLALIQFGGAALNTAPLPLMVWCKIILLGTTAVMVGEVLRFVQRCIVKTA